MSNCKTGQTSQLIKDKSLENCFWRLQMNNILNLTKSIRLSACFMVSKIKKKQNKNNSTIRCFWINFLIFAASMGLHFMALAQLCNKRLAELVLLWNYIFQHNVLDILSFQTEGCFLKQRLFSFGKFANKELSNCDKQNIKHIAVMLFF